MNAAACRTWRTITKDFPGFHHPSVVSRSHRPVWSPCLFSHMQQASRPTFFARKFEASVSQEIISQLDSYLFGAYPSGTPSLQAYWENIYEQQTDGLASLSDSAASHYSAFARMGLTRAASSLQGNPSDSSCRYDRHKFSQAQISASLMLRPLCQLPFRSVLLH